MKNWKLQCCPIEKKKFDYKVGEIYRNLPYVKRGYSTFKYIIIKEVCQIGIVVDYIVKNEYFDKEPYPEDHFLYFGYDKLYKITQKEAQMIDNWKVANL